MRIHPVLYLLGRVLLVLGVAMLVPVAMALGLGEGDALPFVYSLLPTWMIAALLIFFFRKGRNTPIRQREAFLFVTLAWVSAAVLGALPFWFDGMFHREFVDALFDSMSGFTSSGATVLTDVEHMQKALLFWQSFTNWLGGAGIVMLFMAFIRGKAGSSSGAQMFNAEHPFGELADKITPRIGDAVKAMFLVYAALTLLQTVLLMLGGMNLYDALVHTFSTVATSGFSSHNAGLAYYHSAYIEWVVIIFMFLSSINFALYCQLLMRGKGNIFHDEEARAFAIICVVTIALVAVDFSMQKSYAAASPSYIIRAAAMQVVSVISTSGYDTSYYGALPAFSRCLLIMLMFVGGCIGSTASSIKVSRLIVAFKACRNELQGMVHPRIVKKLNYNKKLISQNTVQHVLFFIGAFFVFTLASALALTLSGLDLADALSAALVCISNIGQSLNGVGPAIHYIDMSALAKSVLIFDMLIGRLEIFTVLVLFLPSTWRK